MTTVAVYDGSFEGFLTLVYEVYEQKLREVQVQRQNEMSGMFFSEILKITTNAEKAERVWTGIKRKGSSTDAARIYRSFLSELPQIENHILNYIRLLFSTSRSISGDYTEASVLKLSKVTKMVGREKHRMDAFIRFRLTKDQIYFATIEPDFNVLPLNMKHFKNRYADQKWLIYDLRRNYGIYYNLHKVEMVELDVSKEINSSSKAIMYFTEEEMEFQSLWKNYFNSTNIKSRVNMQLHLRHVPRRYWKYLSEKEPILKK